MDNGDNDEVGKHIINDGCDYSDHDFISMYMKYESTTE